MRRRMPSFGLTCLALGTWHRPRAPPRPGGPPVCRGCKQQPGGKQGAQQAAAAAEIGLRSGGRQERRRRERGQKTEGRQKREVKQAKAQVTQPTESCPSWFWRPLVSKFFFL
jgi:hypothetical protein